MAWFRRDKKSIEQSTPPEERRVRTEGLWVKCESCRTIVFRKDLEANLFVCPKCQFHFKMNSKQRLEMLLDGRWTEHDAGMTSTDPLKFVDTKPYAARLREAKKKLGMNDAVITAEGQLSGRPVVLCAMRSEEHTSELQSQSNLVCRLLLEKKKRHAHHESKPHRIRDDDTKPDHQRHAVDPLDQLVEGHRQHALLLSPVCRSAEDDNGHQVS